MTGALAGFETRMSAKISISAKADELVITCSVMPGPLSGLAACHSQVGLRRNSHWRGIAEHAVIRNGHVSAHRNPNYGFWR